MTASAAVLFILSNAAALFLAAVFASACCRDRPLPVRWIALIGCYLLIASLGTLGLGVAGLLKAWTPCIAVCAAAAAAILLRGNKLRDDLGSLLPVFEPDACRSQSKTLVAPLLALAIGLLSVWIVKSTLLGTYLTFDDKTYHSPSLVSWMLNGKIELTAFSYQSYYPFNAELLALWYMLPFGNDAAVPLIGLVYAILFVLISLEFGRRLQLPLWCRLVPAVLFLSSIEIVSQCNWFADVDIAAPVAMLAALAVGCRDHGGATRRQILLAGALAGFAVGMKPTFAPFAGILLIMVAARLLQRGRSGDAQLAAANPVAPRSASGVTVNGLGFFVAASIAGGYWYIRNLLLTGNPLYPAKLGPFSGPFDGDQQYATTLANAVSNNELASTDYAALSEMLFAWPAAHAVLAILAIVVSAVALTRLLLTTRTVSSPTLAGLTAFALLCLALTPWMPFSARGDDGNFYLEGSSRYLSLAYLCGFLLLPRLLARIGSAELGRVRQWLVFGGLVLLLALPLGRAIDPRFACAALGVGLISLTMLQFYAAGPRPSIDQWLVAGNRPLVWLGSVAAAIVAVALAAPISLRATDGIQLERWLNARVEDLPPGSRLAMYFELRPEFYTLYGRRYQHTPLHLTADGRPAVALHQREEPHGERNFFDYAFDREVAVDLDRFLANLREAQVDFVITPVMPHRGDAWPQQYHWLTSLDVPVRHRSDQAVIWDLRPDTVANLPAATPEVADSNQP